MAYSRNREFVDDHVDQNDDELIDSSDASSSINGVVETSSVGSGTTSRQNGDTRNEIVLTERLTDIFVRENDGDLLLQQSDREDRVLQWLQALDMQVIGACRTDERSKPLFKVNVSNGVAEDRLLARLSQHFEPSEIGLLARCFCIPLVSIRVGKINKQGTVFHLTATSINYHHSGAPKTWYGVPGAEAPGFEKVVQDYVYAPSISSGENGASALLAEKTALFSSNILLKNKVPVYKAVRMARECVITFPREYHAGFSQGFSCGEAVNFAVGEWFPWGEMASREYARLCKMAILPYEELLCKEAVFLCRSSNDQSLDYPSNETASQASVKSSFLSHIKSLGKALWHLNELEASFRYSSNSKGTYLCQLCKRDYYVAFLKCHGCSHSTCFFHDVNSLSCECLKKLDVFVREDIWEVVDAYEKLRLKSGSVEQDISSCIKHGLARYDKLELKVFSLSENCKKPRSRRRL